jgi:hypothetical protein
MAPGALGPNALELEARIVSEAETKAPVDIANKLRDVLHSDEYIYATDIRDYPCQTLSTVECFATYKHGFCQYYAATMAVILRHLHIPTRIVEGFLPGSRDQSSATEEIRSSDQHAWVEVYFPGYGWVPYDPTGSLSQIDPLPTGQPVASGSPRPSGSAPLPSVGARPSEKDDFTGTPGAGGITPGSLGPLVGVLALLLLVVGGLAFVSWQRGPRGPTSPDGAYGTVTRIASRFGFGPRPTQTVYEYAGSLAEVLPAVRPELQMVAQAKVESVYARQIFGEERLASLRSAQRRLRVSLLRLAFRRKDRKNRNRRRR